MLSEVRTSGDIHSTRVLSLDSTGRILDWMSWQDAVCLYVRGAVAWTLGGPCLTIHGGMSRLTGEQSTLMLHPIVASTGHARPAAIDPAPALTNVALFARDRMLCLYCGNHFHRGELTRDHVMPVSKGGRDEWENVVTACWSCNVRKGGRTPQRRQYAAACRAVSTELGRAPDPVEPQHPCRPDGVSRQPPAEESAPALRRRASRRRARGSLIERANRYRRPRCDRARPHSHRLRALRSARRSSR